MYTVSLTGYLNTHTYVPTMHVDNYIVFLSTLLTYIST